MPNALVKILQPHLSSFREFNFASRSAVVGYDGFVDEMVAVVESRLPSGDTRVVPTIADFGRMVSGAAGRSFGRELAAKSVEPGGNAPNFAAGLNAFGIDVDFYGTLGLPIDPVFVDFARSCRSCTSLGPCGRTMALEFGDGKLMLNNTTRLGELNDVVMNNLIDRGEFGARCNEASLLGFANWSRYPHMTDCWQVIARRVLAGLTSRPWVMVDLADPSGRAADDIREMMGLVRSMASTCRVVFGANLNEAGVLLNVLGQPAPSDAPAEMVSAAEVLREEMGVHVVAVHSQRRVAGAWGNPGGDSPWQAGTIAIEGAYNPRPVRTTGVGDRFNAGLSAALVAGLPPEASLAAGCAAGAWFVTVGRPMERGDLAELAARLPR